MAKSMIERITEETLRQLAKLRERRIAREFREEENDEAKFLQRLSEAEAKAANEAQGIEEVENPKPFPDDKSR